MAAINSSYLSLETSFKVKLNFLPDSEFLQICDQCLLRDFHCLRGYDAIQSGVTLCRFNGLSPQYTAKIFSPDFMAKLDAEVADVPSDFSHYQFQIRRSLMLFNRGVCLKYPEYGIPWFHDKFCQEQAMR